MPFCAVAPLPFCVMSMPSSAADSGALTPESQKKIKKPAHTCDDTGDLGHNDPFYDRTGVSLERFLDLSIAKRQISQRVDLRGVARIL
jgi:hypothetical protein